MTPAAAPSRPDPGRGRLTGTGRVTLTRTGGVAPGWRAYVLLYTTLTTDAGQLHAVIAATRPADTDPGWGLQTPRPYGPEGEEDRRLGQWAAAATSPQAKGESAAAYTERLATYLLRVGHSARIAGGPTTVDLPVAQWEIDTDTTVHLTPTKGRRDGYGGHDAVRIGRLLHLAPKEQEAPHLDGGEAA